MGTLSATSARISSHDLAIDAATETLGRRRAVERLVLDQMRVAAWDRLLFVECGDGWVVEEVWRRMGKGCVWGLSTSPQLVELAVRLRGIPGRLEFKAWGGGGDRFPLPDRSFDGVISCVPLTSYLEPAAVLCEMARVLRLDGDAHLLEFEPSSAKIPQAAPVADLGGLLVNTGLKEVGRNRCETALRGQEDRGTPVVIHARRRPPGT